MSKPTTKTAKQLRGPSFSCEREDYLAIDRIIERATKLNPKIDRMTLSMDLAACHCNGCPLDFAKLEAADDLLCARRLRHRPPHRPQYRRADALFFSPLL